MKHLILMPEYRKMRIPLTTHLLLMVGLMVFFSTALQAQDIEVPRTHTFPGIENPAFPYVQPEEVGLSSEKLNRLGDEITEWVANGELIGGELLIIKDGKAVFHEAFGWGDREEKKPVDRNSIWSIKSMSKPFTATAILMLEEEGKLSLEDLVSQYIPNFKGYEQTKIHHLLSHTSGYRNEDLGDPNSSHESLTEWVEDWASRSPSGTFGKYEYTDFGFAAAGYIVEKITGLTIGKFTEDKIIGPLDLEDTSTFFSDDHVWRARLNPWYRWNEEAGQYMLRWPSDWSGWAFYLAAWGMFSTAMDYARFLSMWMNGGELEGVRLLSETTVQKALEPHALVNGHGVYGYGWFVNGQPGAKEMPPVFDHGGGDGTLAVAFPHENAIVIWLTHSRYGSHSGGLMNRISGLEILENPGVELVRAEELGSEEVELSPEARALYIGTYLNVNRGAPTPEAPRVWQEGNQLRIRLGRMGAKADFEFHLVPLGNDRFALGRYRDGRLEATSPIFEVRFQVEEQTANALEFLEGQQVRFTAIRTNPEQVKAMIERERDRTSIGDIVLKVLESRGISAAREQHRLLQDMQPDSVRFGKSILNDLGYRLLLQDRMAEAIAIFEMNVETYPEAANPFDSLGDAYREAGRLEDAKRNYERAVQLAEQQEHQNLETYRRKLKQVIEQLEKQ